MLKHPFLLNVKHVVENMNPKMYTIVNTRNTTVYFFYIDSLQLTQRITVVQDSLSQSLTLVSTPENRFEEGVGVRPREAPLYGESLDVSRDDNDTKSLTDV